MEIRTRFAPSPTGYLHLGGVRTALYSWLYARKMGGKFILRIEDTDRERSTEAAIKAIFDGMHWLGLECDEGPFYQTARFDRYQEVIQQLLDQGKAYRCYCSKERLQKLREEQMKQKQKPRYDGHCRDLNLPDEIGHPHVIRFRNPLDGEVIVNDQVCGDVRFKNSELDDLIIRRSDFTPTYNFCVVIDDWDMKVTHVVRGDDHLNNTPRQINILNALDAPLPVYAHIPMILGADGKKMSKRHGAVGVMNYRDQGILPEAMLNYMVRLGWSHGDQEIFTQGEMIDLFDLSDLNRSAAAFDPQKLLWFNQHYLKTLPIPTIIKHLSWHMRQLDIDLRQGPPLEMIIEAQRERSKTLVEMAEKSLYFYAEFAQFAEKAATKFLIPTSRPILKAVRSEIASIAPEDWNQEGIHHAIERVMDTLDIKMGKVAQPVRVAVTGDTVSPSIDMTLLLIGQERTIKRLDRAIAYIPSDVD